uniref:Uncharacterized protein LOC104216593 n=1 Tax=Nicotiana sylvestris TaxID=4096 RepID=A0A1U7VRI6_NICSY|nr:PREDICTED: uncharacterized protein LOC104216593 [Nicotiana sylvestris]
MVAVMNWPRPITPTEIRSFMGLVGCYRKFMEGFSTLASPLTKLTQKAVKLQWLLAKEVHHLATLEVRLADSNEGGLIVQNRAKSSLVMDVKDKKYNDPLCLWKRIMTEAHTSRYSMHLGSKKMYLDVKEVYWWNDMKRKVADFMERCPNSYQMKDEHQRLSVLAHNIEIPMWKWEMINTDFVERLPHTSRKFDSI